MLEPKKTSPIEDVIFQKIDERVPLKRSFMEALSHWGNSLSLVSGSLSYRHGLGFIVTACDANLQNLQDDDCLFVTSWDFENSRLFFHGKGVPCPASFFHAAIYENRSSAIFSFFDSTRSLVEPVEKVNLSMLQADPTMSHAQLAIKLGNNLGNGNQIAVLHHGVLSFGCTAEDAGTQMMLMRQEIGSRDKHI